MAAIDLSAVFGLPPEDAIAFFRAKGYRITWDWFDNWREAHDRAFTVAKLARLDILQDIRAGLDQALAEGESEHWFVKQLTPVLQQKGWWGKKIVVGEDGQAEVVREGSPQRLRTIFRTNMQTAYAAGRWRAFTSNAADRPYLQYVAIMDGRTRRAHAALHNKVFPIDSTAWRLIAPPNGFNCRCTVRALSEYNIRQKGLHVERNVRIVGYEEPGKKATDKRAGEIYRDKLIRRGISIPDPDNPGKRLTFIPDHGWDYNPGARWVKSFTPTPLDNLPTTFPRGMPLPDVLPPTPVPASRLLPEGLAAEDYARAFLAEFGADIGQGVVYRDVAQGVLTINEDLMQNFKGAWKADKNGRGPYMRLLADAIKDPDEIWLRWEKSFIRPGKMLLKRRYIKSWEINDGNGAHYGLSVFEAGKGEWSGSTVMAVKPDRAEIARREYIEKQRDGFLLYRRMPKPLEQ